VPRDLPVNNQRAASIRGSPTQNHLAMLVVELAEDALWNVESHGESI